MTTAPVVSRRLNVLVSLSLCLTLILTTLALVPVSVRTSAKAQLQDPSKVEQLVRRPRRVLPTPPEIGAPEFTLPNLDEAKRRPHTNPQIAPSIPSTVRSKRKPLKPYDGKKVGDPIERQGVGSSLVRRSTSAVRTHHGRSIAGPQPAVQTNDDAFVQNFISVALNRSLNPNEQAYWTDMIRTAPDVDNRMLVMRELSDTVFESAEYAGRPNRDCSNSTNAHNFVRDLYLTYLMREPENQTSWDFWAHHCLASPQGGDGADVVQTREAFVTSFEFHDLVTAMTLNASASGAASSATSAQLDLFNQTGDQLAARDAEWSLPLISLPGRAGLDLGLSLSYSSMVWTRSGPSNHPYLYFDQDMSHISPGFRLGFASIEGPYFDAQLAKRIYVLVTSSGRRVGLRQVGISTVYESADSSYLQLDDNTTTLRLRTTDGTQITYSRYAIDWQAQEIKDRNGNSIFIQNDWRGDIQSIYDTLNRVLYFDSDSNGNILDIKQIWNGGASWHYWATFGWGAANQMNVSAFSGATAVGTHTDEEIPVLRQVSLPDQTYLGITMSVK